MDKIFKQENFFVKKFIKRKCPCCKHPVINPLKFEKSNPYKCEHCGCYVESSLLLSTITSIVIVGCQVALYNNDMYLLGNIFFTLLIFRWFFLDKFDAIILPLREYEP